MRSDIIFRASEALQNKYKLCQIAAKATRHLHIEKEIMNQPINNAFLRIADGNETQPQPEDV